MLNSTYSKKLAALSDTEKVLNDSQIILLKFIKSKSRFEQLMSVLPNGWENTYKLNFYEDPDEASKAFLNTKRFKGPKPILERTVLSIIVSDKHAAIPGNYDEHLKRDNDYPLEADKWKTYLGLTQFTPASFHIDHKLIWIMQEKEIAFDSEEKLLDVEPKYSINVYVPSPNVLINVENIKLNDLV